MTENQLQNSELINNIINCNNGGHEMCYIKIGKIVIAILYGDNILMYDWNINNNINVEALPKPIGLPVFYIHGGDTNEKYKVYINHGGFVTPCDNIPKTSIYSYNAIFVYSTLE